MRNRTWKGEEKQRKREEKRKKGNKGLNWHGKASEHGHAPMKLDTTEEETVIHKEHLVRCSL